MDEFIARYNKLILIALYLNTKIGFFTFFTSTIFLKVKKS